MFRVLVVSEGEPPLCGGCAGGALVGAGAYEPEDAAVVAHHEGVAFVDDGAVGVGQEVADEFAALHTQWCEAVARLHTPYIYRTIRAVGVQTSHMGLPRDGR